MREDEYWIQEGRIFHADTHDFPEAEDNGSFTSRRLAACQIILVRSVKKDREYINFEFGWWDVRDDSLRRVRYMPSRWAEEFIVALRKAQDYLAEHENEARDELSGKLADRMR